MAEHLLELGYFLVELIFLGAFRFVADRRQNVILADLGPAFQIHSLDHGRGVLGDGWQLIGRVGGDKWLPLIYQSFLFI